MKMKLVMTSCLALQQNT